MRRSIPACKASERNGTPFVAHIASLSADFPGRKAIAPALEIVAREMRPLAVSFFNVAGGKIQSSIVYGGDLSPSELARQVRHWKAELRGREPLAPPSIATLPGGIATPRQVEGRRAGPRSGRLRRLYREIGAVNDLRLLIRDGGRLIAGVTIWRSFGVRPWTPDQLRPLEALQPLIERAYISSMSNSSGVAAVFPATLSRRQREVADLLATGASNRDIARALHISPSTAKSHTREILSCLGAASRRELAMRFAGGASGTNGGELSDPADELLESVLEWSAHRFGAALGGCALLSPRGEPVAESWDAAPRFREGLDPELVDSLHKQVLAAAGEVDFLRAVERDPWTVAGFDAKVAGQADRVLDLVGGLGVSMPILLTLRARGRLAGLLWLCRDASSRDSQAEAEALLRAVQPLLEVCVTIRTARDGGGDSGAPLEVTSRGLSARELTVARMALSGEGNAEIAAQLGIAEATVKKHMTRILAKCGVKSRTELIATRPGVRTTFG